MPVNLKDRSLLRVGDLSPGEITHVLDLADRLKREKRERNERRRLEGCNIALIFEKSSTRTRCAFEVAAADQGARTTLIDGSGSHLGAKESMRDTARVLGRLYDGIEYRGHGQRAVEELARHSGVPVWNGLTDEYHPTQALADLMTMREHHAGSLTGVRLAFLGDAANNTATSLMMAAAKMGVDARFAAPRACWPDAADRVTNSVIAAQASVRAMRCSDNSGDVSGRSCRLAQYQTQHNRPHSNRVSNCTPESIWVSCTYFLACFGMCPAHKLRSKRQDVSRRGIN